MLKPNHSKTFMEYATNQFIPYILSQLHHQSHLDLVLDHCAKSSSQKATARANRGKGICRRVSATASLPGNWHDFLHVDENKEELLNFLSRQVTESINIPDKQFVVTDGHATGYCCTTL